MKIGRNEPCPCGSGKKYKKCCLLKDRSIQVIKVQPSIEKWTTGSVEKLETEQIIEKLASYQISIDIETFTSQIKSVSSAKALVEKWVERFTSNKEDTMVDFLLPAIKVLARRLVPNHFLLETLDDWIQIGYELELVDKSHTVIMWWKAWKQIDKWVTTTDISSIQGIERITNGVLTQPLSNWIEDYDYVLYDLGAEDRLSVTIRKFMAEGFLLKFPNSDKTFMDRMIVAKGESAFLLGEQDEADLIFQDYANEHSNNTWIYLHWGDLYNPEMNTAVGEKDKAIFLYKKAINNSSIVSVREAAVERLKELGIGVEMKIFP